MQSWTVPSVPALPGRPAPLRLFDTASGTLKASTPGRTARMYVCGITPYDATHLGHAATYLTFDLINRLWRDAGHRVRYAQNVTDVDDPLLERAHRDGVDWRELATSQIELYREDSAALRILPPDDFVGAVEAVDEIAAAVAALIETGAAYRVDDDVYFSISAASHFGEASGLARAQMIPVFAENGGDPDREGKKDKLDPLLWRGAREGEPSWTTEVGAGRPGWHIECATIATNRLGMNFDVQGGGRDLVFPHHEMSSAHAEVLTGTFPMASHFVHVGMMGLHGEKMSKSRGNLVFVRRLRERYDPSAIRLALLAAHYRGDRIWREDDMSAATGRLARWREAAAVPGAAAAAPLIEVVRERLADDLDTPGALTAIDAWVDATLSGDRDDPQAASLVATMTDALLGIALR